MSEKRPFGFWTATALVVGGMIGSGIFMQPAQLAHYGWASVLAWAISIGGALAIAWCLSSLASQMPEETGAIAITASVLGRLVGVLVGWSYWISVWTAVAAIAIAATAYISVFLPALNAQPAYGALCSVALIWLMTLLNLGGARLAGRFQLVTTILKLVPLAVVIVIAAWLAWAGALAPPSLPAGFGVAALTAPVTLTFFPLVGFETASVAAERVQRPEVTIRRATMAGTALTGLLYIVVCSGIVLALPADKLAASAAPFALFVETYWGPGAALMIAAFAAIAAIGALNCWVLIQGEVPLSMARAGLIPRWFAKTRRHDAPARVLILSSVAASLLVLFTVSGSLARLFEIVLLITTSSSLWFYLAVCIAALVRRVATPAALLGAAFALWALWGAGVAPSAFSLLLTLTALPLYLISRGRGAMPRPATPAG
ncbi:MAG: amino acid permease [Sphingomonas sanxanigenens]|uniref:Arginine/agmatine antiporter n=1 Tax=Sphingomonas sanxanigenens TaxID=397260 RepID=A0A2W5C2G9_9SPHN|nr:MAG: amino acid permease [Sphingomonas sanxanigenens]